MEAFAKKLGFKVIGLLFSAVAALLFAVIVMWLWNWLLPDIFGLRSITFIEGWGLSYLAGFFFKAPEFVEIGNKKTQDK